MSVEPNTEWYETTHHELGHIYYYLCYTNPEVPLLLREGANRAYHEAVGSLMGLAAMQPRFVRAIGLDAGEGAVDPMQQLLREALNYVVFIPWCTGTMFHFEKELYADELPSERWNARWWELAAKYQGIEPPGPRDERYCDGATKTHVNNDPAGYYDYALSFVLLFQLHDHIAGKILHEDPRDTNYFGRKEVGEFATKFRSKDVAKLEYGELIGEMFAIGRKYRVHPVTDMMLVFVALITAQGIGKMLEPEHNVFATVAVFLMPILMKRNEHIPNTAEAKTAAAG